MEDAILKSIQGGYTAKGIICEEFFPLGYKEVRIKGEKVYLQRTPVAKKGGHWIYVGNLYEFILDSDFWKYLGKKEKWGVLDTSSHPKSLYTHHRYQDRFCYEQHRLLDYIYDNSFLGSSIREVLNSFFISLLSSHKQG